MYIKKTSSEWVWEVPLVKLDHPEETPTSSSQNQTSSECTLKQHEHQIQVMQLADWIMNQIEDALQN